MKTLPAVMLTSLVALAVPDAAVLGGQTSTAAYTPLAPLSARLEKERDNAALQKVAPFKVFDNLYYVGVGWVASWLMSTSDGLILIDTLEPRYVDHLLDSVAKLGLDPKNIKHVIVLQAHADHLGGA